MTSPLSAQRALEIILESLQPVGVEPVPLTSSFKRVLAEDVVAQEDIPPFDNSAMDGFAVRSEDTRRAGEQTPVMLTVAGEIAAGQIPSANLTKGDALRIMTGAPIPPGADAVIEQEAVSVVHGKIVVQHPIEANRNIRERGIDIRKGSTVLRKGTRIGPAHLGVLASLGVEDVSVFKEPSVAMLVTGNELAEGPTLRPASIRNSNSHTISALIRNSFCGVRDLGVAADDPEALRALMEQALSSDVVITTGGVSVGAYDLVLKTWMSLGVRIIFWKVNIKPGMPMAFGEFKHGHRSTFLFGLPGNPVSCYVTFLRFVRPALRAMQGETEIEEVHRLSATLEHSITKSDGKRHFVRGIVRNENGALFVRTTGTQSSAALSSLVAANCLIILPEEKRDIKAGEQVEIELLME